VPDLIGATGQNEAVGFDTPLFIEKAQLDFGRMGGKQREIDPVAVPRRSKGR
jgi:hypothetical protein